MNFPGRFRDHIVPQKIHLLNLSFAVPDLQEHFGGTAGNIAYSLALLGLRPEVVAAVGKDFSDRDYCKGIVKTKVDEVDMRVFMLDTTLRNLIGRTDYNVNEISIIAKPGTDPLFIKNALIKNGAEATAKVQTFEEGMPKFVTDMKNTFAILGNVVGSIGLVVASITIFIVIFVNAITRRKFIGILKGIGISSKAIEIAYVFQSLFYAILGIGIGLLILYGFLVPFIEAHPIKFPFSDGILMAEVGATFLRVFLLALATLIAGYVPARIVVKKNTLDSILGR